MTLELKRLTTRNLEAALAKASAYRDLNQPEEAESICRDVLRAEPGNQEAVVALVLALTDQFVSRHGADMSKAREALAQVKDEYERATTAQVGTISMGGSNMVLGARKRWEWTDPHAASAPAAASR